MANTVDGDVDGTVVQAGIVRDGLTIHVHPREAATPAASHTLPAPPRVLVGRHDDLAALLVTLDPGNASRDQGGSVVMAEVAGMPGVGKTAQDGQSALAEVVAAWMVTRS
ncbi:hypothetical protein ACFOVU_19605 [Nocardiopsis sediminis]|uniref:Uncharacterized protein n=1 Tax=Nocardiopsis sediminis TaxID=1778267 RepID=A0ABV8FU00_9ACTN